MIDWSSSLSRSIRPQQSLGACKHFSIKLGHFLQIMFTASRISLNNVSYTILLGLLDVSLKYWLTTEQQVSSVHLLKQHITWKNEILTFTPPESAPSSQFWGIYAVIEGVRVKPYQSSVKNFMWNSKTQLLAKTLTAHKLKLASQMSAD